VPMRFYFPLAVLGIAAARTGMAQDDSVVSVKLQGKVYAWETNNLYASESPYGDNYGLSTVSFGGALPTSDANDSGLAESSASGSAGNVFNIINNNTAADSDDNSLILLFAWILDALGFGGSDNSDSIPQDSQGSSDNTVTVTVTDKDNDTVPDVTATADPADVSIVYVTQVVEQSTPPSYNSGFYSGFYSGGVVVAGNAVANANYVPVTVTDEETVMATVTVTAEPVVQPNIVTQTNVVVSQVPVVQTVLTASAQIVQVVGPTYTSIVSKEVQYYNNYGYNNQVVSQPVNVANPQPNVYTL
ncbi:hypothetical protein GGI23_004343, partial [Coemansia sp. RSA 2559]